MVKVVHASGSMITVVVDITFGVVCVVIPFFTGILQVRLVCCLWIHQAGSHRIFPPSFCCACLNFYREKDSAVLFPRRP